MKGIEFDTLVRRDRSVPTAQIMQGKVRALAAGLPLLLATGERVPDLPVPFAMAAAVRSGTTTADDVRLLGTLTRGINSWPQRNSLGRLKDFLEHCDAFLGGLHPGHQQCPRFPESAPLLAVGVDAGKLGHEHL